MLFWISLSCIYFYGSWGDIQGLFFEQTIFLIFAIVWSISCVSLMIQKQPFAKYVVDALPDWTNIINFTVLKSIILPSLFRKIAINIMLNVLFYILMYALFFNKIANTNALQIMMHCFAKDFHV